MAKAKRVRWECPNGLHPAVLGSTRPPMDATVRVCLSCSASEARLVKRVAPALERQRAAKAADRKAAPARAAASLARRASVECVDALGRTVVVDLLAEVESCCAQLGHKPAKVTVQRVTRRYPESGRGYPQSNRVHFTVGPDATAERLREVALHEVLHVADGTRVEKARGRSSWHGPRFKRALYDAARERWPEIRGLVADESLIRSPKAYDLDDLIVEALLACTRLEG